MEQFLENIIYINIIILIAGATSIHLGASFLKRERHSRGFFKYSVFLLALGNGLCCLGYSIMSMSTNLFLAYIFRVIGLIGIEIYLIAEIILVTSCLNFGRLAEILIIGIASMAASFDVFIYGNPATDKFIRYETFTSFIRSDPYRHVFHYTYLGVMALSMLAIAIIWALNAKYKREKKLITFAFLSNFILLFSAFPDLIKTRYDISFAHIFYCAGIFMAFVVFYVAANNYMAFNITVNSISRDIFSTLGTGLLVFDTNYHLNLSNNYANKLLGLDKEPGRIRLKEIFTLKSGEPLRMFEKAATGVTTEYRLTSDVTGKATLVNFSCKLDKNHQPMCYILVATDLTEENRLIQEAQAANEAKSQFISNISHEIRTPLNILSGFTQVLTSTGMDIDENTRSDINRQITENTNRITGLVNKMLALSDAGSKMVIEQNDDVSPLQIATQAASDAGINEAKRIVFDLQVDDEAKTIMLHTNLQQSVSALSLLLDNALKFTKQGRVTLRVAIQLLASEHNILFTVEDTGIGVPPEEAEHIFEEFVQLDNYYNGTGIGLTIARSIARRLGGDIVLDTSYTEGARFVMSLKA
jgi:signal transduction histidine kinase